MLKLFKQIYSYNIIIPLVGELYQKGSFVNVYDIIYDVSDIPTHTILFDIVFWTKTCI